MRTLTTLLLSFCIVNTIFGQTDTSQVMKFSLSAAQEYAVQNATGMKNADLNAKISKKRTLEIITEGLPQISGSINYVYNYKQQKSIIPAGAFSPQELEVTFVNPFQGIASLEWQQLLVDGRYFLGLKANKAIVAVSEQQVEMTAIDLKNQVAKSYYAALTAKESKLVIEKSYKTVQQLLKETEATYKEGLIEELDVDRLKVSLTTIESQLKNIDLQATLALNFLKYQMGLDFEQKVELTDELEPLLTLDDVSQEVFSFNPQSRIEFRLLTTQHELRGYDAKRFALGYAPALYGSFTYGANAFGTEANLLNRTWFGFGALGVSLQVPIFDSFKKGSQYQQKKLEQQQAFNNLKDFENSSKVQVGNAYLSYQTSFENYKNLKANVELANKIFNTVQIKYKNGVGNSFELANAESSYTQAIGNYTSGMYNLLAAKTDLDKALGKIK